MRPVGCGHLLLDDGPDGRWVTEVLTGADLVAPQPMSFECANIIGRLELAGLVSADQASQAHAELLDLDVEPWPYDLLAERAWELGRNLSSYDASCAAFAEPTGATLVTLDRPRIPNTREPRIH